MIVAHGLRGGTHSASAIFKQARQIPVLAHAVRVAPREWWRDRIRYFGDAYDAHFIEEHLYLEHWLEPMRFQPGDYVVYAKMWQGYGSLHARLNQRGVRRGEAWLAHPWPIFHALAERWGLICRACDVVELHDRCDEHFLCKRCTRQAERAGSVEAFLARKIFKRVQQIKKEQRA